jgi:hypothetical protein
MIHERLHNILIEYGTGDNVVRLTERWRRSIGNTDETHIYLMNFLYRLVSKKEMS